MKSVFQSIPSWLNHLKRNQTYGQGHAFACLLQSPKISHPKLFKAFKRIITNRKNTKIIDNLTWCFALATWHTTGCFRWIETWCCHSYPGQLDSQWLLFRFPIYRLQGYTDHSHLQSARRFHLVTNKMRRLIEEVKTSIYIVINLGR